MIRFLLAAILVFCTAVVIVRAQVPSFDAGMMMNLKKASGGGGGGGGGGGSGACNSPAVPHPAQVAGFTTLAYCADFTTDTGTNNYASNTFGTMVWSNTVNWLNCFGTRSGGADPASPQWELSSGGVGTVVPCADISVAHDSVSGVNALQVLVPQGLVDGVAFVQTGSGGCNFGCYESFPTTNLYIEYKYRIDATAYAQRPSGGGNDLAWDIFNYFLGAADNGNVETDIYEVPSGDSHAVGIGPGLLDWTGGSPTDGNNNSQPLGNNIDNNYHIVGALNTANSSITNIGMCTYYDGVAGNCDGIAPRTTGGYKQQGYSIIWNTAGHQAGGGNTSSPVNFTGYVAYMRVWSCSGWSSTGAQTPASSSTTNTCSSSTVYNSGTPP